MLANKTSSSWKVWQSFPVLSRQDRSLNRSKKQEGNEIILELKKALRPSYIQNEETNNEVDWQKY